MNGSLLPTADDGRDVGRCVVAEERGRLTRRRRDGGVGDRRQGGVRDRDAEGEAGHLARRKGGGPRAGDGLSDGAAAPSTARYRGVAQPRRQVVADGDRSGGGGVPHVRHDHRVQRRGADGEVPGVRHHELQVDADGGGRRGGSTPALACTRPGSRAAAPPLAERRPAVPATRRDATSARCAPRKGVRTQDGAIRERIIAAWPGTLQREGPNAAGCRVGIDQGSEKPPHVEGATHIRTSSERGEATSCCGMRNPNENPVPWLTPARDCRRVSRTSRSTDSARPPRSPIREPQRCPGICADRARIVPAPHTCATFDCAAD